MSSLTSHSSQASVELYNNRIKPEVQKNAGARVVNVMWHPRSLHVPKRKTRLELLQRSAPHGSPISCSSVSPTTLDHKNQPYELDTPTVETTAMHLLNGVGNRTKSFLEGVMKRDGYTCVVTGFQDPSHPKPTAGTIELCSTHILRRAIGEFDPKSESYKSALTTFDILVNFTRLPFRTLEELRAKLDDPSNGMMLQSDAHRAFDRFYWCLKKTETEHVYDLKVFVDRNLIRKPANNRITFVDHSNDLLPESTRKRNRPIDLPDPRYIEIHAAIAGILHMSGAGKFFDELLDEYQDDEGNVPGVRCWPELEILIGAELLRESVTQMFQSVQMH